MAKGYWIAHVEVSDTLAYENYKKANAVAFAKYGAQFVVRGGRQELIEGFSKSRTVVIEFSDYETALACYRSPEYTKALKIRRDISIGDLVIVEGI